METLAGRESPFANSSGSAPWRGFLAPRRDGYAYEGSRFRRNSRKHCSENCTLEEKRGGHLADRGFDPGKTEGREKVNYFRQWGSAADAQHLAAEFVGRYRSDREPLPAIALTTDTSVLTAVGNDYGFAEVFARQISALGEAGDVALAMSTRGDSPNVLRGLQVARERGLLTVGLTGGTGGKMKALVDICLCVPSDVTPRIQESHALVAHIVSCVVEGNSTAQAGRQEQKLLLAH